MELLIRLRRGRGPDSDPLTLLLRSPGRGRRFVGARRFALTTSIVVHSAMALGIATLSSKASTPVRDETVVVDVVTEMTPEPLIPLPDVPSEPAPRRAALPSARIVRPSHPAAPARSARPALGAPAEPAPSESLPREDTPPEPTHDSPAAAEMPPALAKPELLAAVVPGTIGASGRDSQIGLASGSHIGSGSGHGTGAGAGISSGANRQALTDGYLKELFRSRIRMRYPEAARELELSGTVTVEVTVARNGRLVRAQITRRCPHAILCEDALATIRAAAPFPPLPAELGEAARIEVPLAYAIE